MLTRKLFQAAYTEGGAVVTGMAIAALGPLLVAVPATTLAIDATIATGRAISAARKRRAEQRERDRQRRHELLLERERIAHQERVEAKKPKPKSKKEQVEELQTLYAAVINGIRLAPMDEETRQALINLKFEEMNEKLGQLLC
jgi:hypothetical protein